MKSSLVSSVLGLVAVAAMPHAARAISVQLVADNDFAVYAGTASSITREIYQNNTDWGNQLAAASSFSFELQPGETTFYVLGMGGGGPENISGSINGVNLYDIYANDNTKIKQSGDVSGFLSNYTQVIVHPIFGPLGTSLNPDVEAGTYTPSLSDVQTALAGTTFGTPTPVSGTPVVNSNPYAESSIFGGRVGFDIPSETATLFQFGVEQVGAVPEPSTAASLAGFGALAFAIGRRRAVASRKS